MALIQAQYYKVLELTFLFYPWWYEMFFSGCNIKSQKRASKRFISVFLAISHKINWRVGNCCKRNKYHFQIEVKFVNSRKSQFEIVLNFICAWWNMLFCIYLDFTVYYCNRIQYFQAGIDINLPLYVQSMANLPRVYFCICAQLR